MTLYDFHHKSGKRFSFALIICLRESSPNSSHKITAIIGMSGKHFLHSWSRRNKSTWKSLYLYPNLKFLEKEAGLQADIIYTDREWFLQALMMVTCCLCCLGSRMVVGGSFTFRGSFTFQAFSPLEEFCLFQ